MTLGAALLIEIILAWFLAFARVTQPRSYYRAAWIAAAITTFAIGFVIAF